MERESGTMTSDDLSCRELVELVTDYLEGALPSVEQARFEAHLAGCFKCGDYLEQMRRTIRTLGRLTEDAVAPPAREQLLQAFRGWKRA
jgi:predicted anti-sigma-YlaC factor YlaD